MLTFSPTHAWQADRDVQQILVFPNEAVEADFHKLFGAELAAKGDESADCRNKGAIYMLRAVSSGSSKFRPLILCGFTGLNLWAGSQTYSLPVTALRCCMDKLRNNIYGSLSGQLLTLV